MKTTLNMTEPLFECAEAGADASEMTVADLLEFEQQVQVEEDLKTSRVSLLRF